MDDIFQKALTGDTNAIIGLYACSVESAYAAIFAVTGEEKSATEMVKEIYLWAFSGAKSYEEFFTLLNARANKACKVLIDKNAALTPIAPNASVFANVQAMALPEELKSFPEALGAIVIHRQAEQVQKPASKRFKLGKKEKQKPKSELEEFEELVKKREFSAINEAYVTPQAAPEQAPKTIAEKMQPEETVVTDEQKIRNRLEMEKSKKASIIAFAFAGVILIGAIVTCILTAQNHEFHPKTIPATTQAQITTQPLTNAYSEGEQKKAFEEYLQNVVMKEYRPASMMRIIAYNQTNTLGIDQLCGILTTKIVDLDGDGVEEMAVIRSDVSANGTIYSYSFRLDLYDFYECDVRTVVKDYNLLTYTVYNHAIEYELCNFDMDIQLLSDGTTKRILTRAISRDMKCYSVHYFSKGNLNKAEELVFIEPSSGTRLYLQKNNDGTYLPLCCELYGRGQNSLDAMDEESRRAVENYRYTISTKEVKYPSVEAMLEYVNSLTAKFGCKFADGFALKLTVTDSQTLCSLKARNEQGDMLSWQEVVQLEDYTNSNLSG